MPQTRRPRMFSTFEVLEARELLSGARARLAPAHVAHRVARGVPAAVAHATAANAFTFQINNKTSGAFPASAINVGIYAQDANDASAQNPLGWSYIDASGKVTPLTPANLTVPTFTLDKTAKGAISVPLTEGSKELTLVSGQLYFGLGSAPVLAVNTGLSGFQPLPDHLAILNGGSGYSTTAAPTIAFSGGGGAGAVANVLVSNGAVSALNLTSGGSGYSKDPLHPPTVGFSSGGAVATAQVDAGGTITRLLILNGGSGYDAKNPPTVTITDAAGSNGSGAAATAAVTDGAISSIVITGTGKGYTSVPTATITANGGGSGASVLPQIAIDGVSAPAPSNANDPNTKVNWNFAEFTYNPSDQRDNGKSKQYLNADVSQVDQTSFPLTIQINPADSNALKAKGSGFYQGRTVTYAGFQTFVKKAHPDFLPLLTGSPKGPKGPYRILAPSNYVLLNPGSTLAHYFDSTIQSVFKVGNTITGMKVPVVPKVVGGGTGTVNGSGGISGVAYDPKGSGYPFAPKVIFDAPPAGTTATAHATINAAGEVDVVIDNPGSGYSAANPPRYRLDAGDRVTVNGTVVTLPDGKVAYQFKLADGSDPTVFNVYSPNNPINNPGGGPSWQVFACAGAFADDTKQFPSNIGLQRVLGNIENQIVSAFNRGVVTKPYDSWTDTTGFYAKGSVSNWYAAFLHQITTIKGKVYGLYTMGGRNYGFAYDDQGDSSSDLATLGATQMTINLGWNLPVVPTQQSGVAK